MRRIVAASSNTGDIVLDCFAGSGTTLAVADELQRNWIGVDNSPEAFSTILERFKRGLQPMGDYRTQRRQSEDIYVQMSLFESRDLKLVAGDEKLRSQYTSVSDFSVYCDIDRMAEVSQITDKWLGPSQ